MKAHSTLSCCPPKHNIIISLFLSSISSYNYGQLARQYLTVAAESVDGQCVARIARALIRTLSVGADLLTQVQIFITFDNIYSKQNSFDVQLCSFVSLSILLTATSSSIWVQPIASVAATHVGANSVGAHLLTSVHGGIALIKIQKWGTYNSINHYPILYALISPSHERPSLPRTQPVSQSHLQLPMVF